MDSATPHQQRSSGTHPYVPHGVDAGSWLGFEQRIQERRFRALLETARQALAAGHRDAARDALAEARLIRPDAAELHAFEQPLLRTSVEPPRHRASGAVALLAVGIGLLLAVDGFRYRPATSVTPPVPVRVLTTEPPVAVATIGALDEATSAGLDDAPAEAVPRVAIEEFAPPVTREREPVAPLAPRVARTLATPVPVERDPTIPAVVQAGPAVVPAAPAVAAVDAVSASSIATVPSAAPATGPMDETRVTATLQRYAKAYTELDARAARSVWPSVNERALSNAFSGLAAQSLDFQDCEVVVRQVEADAVCRGTTSYVTRVGSSSPRVEPRTWHFELSRHGDDWLIDTAVARR
jgi:hypothetical protein